jgi:hypothetical protein
LIAACTSCVAPSMSRLRSNCSEIWLTPNELVEFIEPATDLPELAFQRRGNQRGGDVRTRARQLVVTCTVGKSTCGSADTGSAQYPSAPPIISATPSSEVAMGRRMNGSETLIDAYSRV